MAIPIRIPTMVYYGSQAPQQQYEYVEPEQSYWYFCQDPEGYYPYVKQCPKGWQKVVPKQAPEGE